MEKQEQPEKGPKRRLKLGDYLIKAGLIDEKALANALEIQKVQKKRIGKILIDMGVADDESIARALAAQLNIPFARLTDVQIPQEIIALVPAELAENYLLLPVRELNRCLVVAMANPLEIYAIDDLRFVTRMPISIVVSPERDIIAALHKYYPKKDLEADFSLRPGIDEGLEIVQPKEDEDKDVHDLMQLTSLPPIVRFTNSILADAIRLKASDIHIEPQKNSIVVRYRVDGIMREIMETDKQVHASVVSRIKIISDMDISVRRKPQDGRSQIRYSGKVYDLRVSTIPTAYGEKVTIRILDQHKGGMTLDTLGFSPPDLKRLVDAISRPQGMVLVTGPTGSGKSSTLYACLNKLNSQEVNIITVEDPIEYEIQGINQVQINPSAGITFATGLRSILRQDPDIVMVGEIRDYETAEIAFQAAQTGHLVLSTLHTNDAPSAITRLMDLGIQPFLISSALLAVVGQRLVRKICPKCKAIDPLAPKLLEKLPVRMVKDMKQELWKGTGCEFCQYTGYSGRMGIFQVMSMTPYLRDLVVPNVAAHTLAKAATRDGFTTISQDGIDKVFKGITTVDEVLRVAPPEEEPAQSSFVASTEEADNETEAAVESRPSVGSVKPVKILVADDSELVLRLISNVLESEGYLVMTARDGEEALKVATQEKPDLIVTDVMMPIMDGISLTKKLKANLTTRYIPVIILTAREEVESEVAGIEAGADDYLTKPVNPKRLVARIRRLLNRPSIARI
ncbi:MAG: response regulator [Desulfobacteraceae bacterium]|nr:MAG: response regulator [Desulfobacteraceae bacterium]